MPRRIFASEGQLTVRKRGAREGGHFAPRLAQNRSESLVRCR